MDAWTPMHSTTVQEIEDYMKSLNLPEKQEKYDSVSKPKHYMLFEDQGIEVRDVLSKLVTKLLASQQHHPLDTALFESDYVQMMQYLISFMDKNGVEDLKKARWYLDKMIEAY